MRDANLQSLDKVTAEHTKRFNETERHANSASSV